MGKGFAGMARLLHPLPAPLFFTLAKKIQIIEIYQLGNSNIWIYFQKTGSIPPGNRKKRPSPGTGALKFEKSSNI